jgi:hypothetical protein
MLVEKGSNETGGGDDPLSDVFSCRFWARVMTFEASGGGGRRIYSGRYIIARYQWKLPTILACLRDMNGPCILLVDRNNDILLCEDVDLGRPFTNTLVAVFGAARMFRARQRIQIALTTV